MIWQVLPSHTVFSRSMVRVWRGRDIDQPLAWAWVTEATLCRGLRRLAAEADQALWAIAAGEAGKASRP